MTRKTNTTDKVSQFELDKFWNWIEGMPVTDEMWKVEANGDMTIEVDEKTLIEILKDDLNKAWYDFDYYSVRENETGEHVYHGLPYELLGTYIIKGVYDANQRLVDGERTYFFVQGA
jgi:hypothetical protein